jgi:hypothetical protein
MDSNKGGSTTGTTGTTSPSHTVTEHLNQISNPTDYLSVFRSFVGRASQIGVSQQQLLDTVSDGYTTRK